MALTANPISLGKLTVASAGTPVALTVNFSGDAAYTGAMSSYVEVQANPANTGVLYLGHSGMNTSTGVGVIAIIEKGKSWKFDPAAGNGIFIKPSDLRVDAATNGDWAVAYFCRA